MSRLEIALDNIYYDLDHQFKVHLSTFEHDVNRKKNDATSNFTTQLHHLLHKYLLTAQKEYKIFQSNLQSKDEYDTFLMDTYQLFDKYINDFNKMIGDTTGMQLNVDDLTYNVIMHNKNEMFMERREDDVIFGLRNFELQLLNQMDNAFVQFSMEYNMPNAQQIDLQLNENELERKIKCLEAEMSLCPLHILHNEEDYMADALYVIDQLDAAIEYFSVENQNYSNQQKVPDQHYSSAQKMTTNKNYNHFNTTKQISYLFSFQPKLTSWKNEHQLQSTPFHRKHINRKKFCIPKYFKYKICCNGLIQSAVNGTNYECDQSRTEGDSKFSRPSNKRYIDIHISSLGANRLQYSLMLNEYTGRNARQTVDMECLMGGQQFLISSDNRFRLLNAADLTLGVEYIPSVLFHKYHTHCPTVTIWGRGTIQYDLKYLLWNEINQVQRNLHEFNHSKKEFTVGTQIASCKTVTIENSQYMHDHNRMLFVYEVRVIQRTIFLATERKICDSANHPCNLNSRGRKIGLIHDDNQWILDKLLSVLSTYSFQFELNGWTRKFVCNLTIDNDNYRHHGFVTTFDYKSGTSRDRFNRRLYMQIEIGDCVFMQTPIVNINGYKTMVTDIFDLPSSELADINERWSSGEELVYFMLPTSLFDDLLFSSLYAKPPITVVITLGYGGSILGMERVRCHPCSCALLSSILFRSIFIKEGTMDCTGVMKKSQK